MLDLDTIPKKQDAVRAAEWLAEKGIETILCVPVQELDREAQASMTWWDSSRLVLILGAEVIRLRERLDALESERVERTAEVA